MVLDDVKNIKVFVLLLLIFCYVIILVYKVFNGVTIIVVKDNGDSINITAGLIADALPKSMSSEPTTPPELPKCPEVPPNLIGPLATYRDGPEFEEIAKKNPGLRKGGLFSPPDCKARHKVAIVIPFRNRSEHLHTLVHNLHPFLSKQQLEYGIYVIDQAPPGHFNRAMLMNIGYIESMKRHDYGCTVFHDVDLVPENDKNIYSCTDNPRHLSCAIDKYDYELHYPGIAGGVTAVRKDVFEKMNGYSNLYFGWGGEDDDLAFRMTDNGYKIVRYPMEIARYKMLSHGFRNETGNKPNPLRYKLLNNVTARAPNDGIHNMAPYTVNTVEELPTHTRIEVFIDEEEVMKGWNIGPPLDDELEKKLREKINPKKP